MTNLRRIAIACVVAAILMLGAMSIAASDSLEKSFLNPPDSAKPHTWWHWMNGNISREGITADLEAMKSVGLGGAQIFNVDCGIPAGPIKVMSPEWIGMMKHAVSEANRLGLELCMHNCAGWSSSGGPWITPELAMQEPVWSERKISGPSHFSEILPQPKSREGFYRDITVLAFRSESLPENSEQIRDIRGKAAFDRRDHLDPDLSPVQGGAIPPDGVIDISKNMSSDGRLTWDVPDGQWTILRMGYTPTGARNAPSPPEARGLECDKLSKEALDAHWAGMMAPVLKTLGPAAGRSLNNVLIDSYEMGHQNWTPRFREEFAKRCGYDILPFLPVITGRVVGSPEISERFLWDFRRTIANMYAENYVGHFTELCHANGLMSSIEPYGNATFDNLQCGGRADIVMGEFWVRGWGVGAVTKMAASAIHTNGGKYVGAESFTATEEHAQWRVDPYSMKALGDQIYCDGVNRFIMHRYAHQPWLNVSPGMTMGPWGTNFERTVTWWDQSTGWLSYLSRCQSLLQSGLFCADVCYFNGEGAANDLKDRAKLSPVLPAGYDYDACDASVVLQRMSVRNGRITLPDGMSYRILVLPESKFMTPKMLTKIAELVKAGATVVGPKPTKSPSLSDFPACDIRIAAIADQVWGDCDGNTVKEHKFGKGRVVSGKDMAAVLRQMQIWPDFSTAGKYGKDRLSWIHRKAGNADIYFVANRTYTQVTVECRFRQWGKVPEFWSPDTGKIADAPIYRESSGMTTVPISFDPAGSVFVVFRKPAGKSTQLVSVTRSGSGDIADSIPIPHIIKATYGAPNNAAHSADVTKQIATMLADQQFFIPATNDTLGGDPAPLIAKELKVEYTVGAKTLTATVPENGTLDLTTGRGAQMPEFEVEVGKHNQIELKAWKPGVYTMKTADGKVRQLNVKSGAKTQEIAGPWKLQFPDGWGAPKQVALDKLISWTEHADAGVRYFSGTAKYVKDFDLPKSIVGSGKSVVLDLGKVKNFAEVTLNGKKLDVLWKEPFRADVTALVHAEKNHLEVSVTNLWPNRIIGDEQQPDDNQWNGNTIAKVPQWVTDGGPKPQNGRYTFATWRFYNKDSKLLESGLLGPVVVHSVKILRAL